MKLKLLAPVRTDFSVVTELPIREPDRYARFWDDVAERKDERRLLAGSPLQAAVAALRFPHGSAHRRSPYNRYQSLESDALERPLHVLEVVLDGAAFAAGAPEGALVHRLERVVVRVFDHGISLLEADLALGDWAAARPASEVEPALDGLQQAGIALGERLARRVTDDLLGPLFVWLRSEVPTSSDVVEPPLDAEEPTAFGAVLWVTRTLVLEPGDGAHREAVVRHWVKDSGGQDEHEGTALADALVADPERHLTRWLNYLFREGAYPAPEEPGGEGGEEEGSDPSRAGLARPFCDAWEAMLYAQFFYAALDVVDGHLTRILARSLSGSEHLRIDDLKALLERNIRKAHLLLLQFHDSAKYYRRTVKAEMDAILDYWGFEAVLVQPVERKIELCQERLTLLHQQEAAKSGIYTDMILLGIGITTIVGTSLALAEYGRTMASDADLASYDVTSTNLIDRFATLPTDVILVASGLVSLLLVAFYFYFRKQQTV